MSEKTVVHDTKTGIDWSLPADPVVHVDSREVSAYRDQRSSRWSEMDLYDTGDSLVVVVRGMSEVEGETVRCSVYQSDGIDGVADSLMSTNYQGRRYLTKTSQELLNQATALYGSARIEA